MKLSAAKTYFYEELCWLAFYSTQTYRHQTNPSKTMMDELSPCFLTQQAQTLQMTLIVMIKYFNIPSNICRLCLCLRVFGNTSKSNENIILIQKQNIFCYNGKYNDQL